MKCTGLQVTLLYCQHMEENMEKTNGQNCIHIFFGSNSNIWSLTFFVQYSLSPITLEWKIEISPKSIQTVRLSIPITVQSLKWIGQGVLNLQRDIRKIALKSRTIWWIKSHNSGMKIQNFTIKYTDRKTINSNNSVKFEVNWPRGS
jgi:hypothetical protein